MNEHDKREILSAIAEASQFNHAQHQLTRDLIRRRSDRLYLAIQQLAEALKPKPQLKAEIKFMIKTNADQADVQYSFTDKVTDDKGNEITDPAVLASLVKTVASDNPDVIVVTPDPDPSSGNVHWTGKTGVVGITASIAKSDGTIFGSGGVTVTVVAGDPAAVSDIKLALGDLVDA